MVNPFEALLNKQQPAGAELMLATVDTVTNEGLTLIPDGETEATQKKYKYMTSAYAEPASGDRVVVMCLSGTYVVLGKIGSSTPASGKYVRRSGDTMTGNLTVRDASLNMDDPDVTVGTRPSTNQWSKPFRIRDSAGKSLARILGFYGSNGKCGIQIYGDQIVNGEDKYNYLGLYMDDSGVASVEMNNPGAWRSALNAVNKAGDTMTGSLTLSAGNAGIYEDTTAYEVGVPPSSDFYTIGLRNRDKNGTVFTAFNSALLSNGNIAARMIVTKGSISNYLQLVIDSNNNQSISISNAQAWRKALGLGTNGALPLTVAQGGSGNTGTVATTTISDIITAGTGFSITSAAYYTWGKLAMINIHATVNTATTSGAWHLVGTLISGKRPANTIFTSELNKALNALYSNGQLNVWGEWASGKKFEFSAVYLLP